METLHVGLMPFNYADELPRVRLSRRQLNLDWPLYVNRGHNICLNVINEFKYYDNDTFKIKLTAQLPKLATISPAFIALQNEELHVPAGTTPKGTIQQYCEQLKIATEILKDFRVTNGGFTLQLYQWYWKNFPDPDFFQYCIPDNMKSNLAAGKIDLSSIDYEMQYLKTLPLAFWNPHFYLRNEGEVQPLIKCFNVVSEFLNLPCSSNEAGIYDPDLLQNVVDVAKGANMRWLILYNGEGVLDQVPPLALPISKEKFFNLIV